ncbi:MAG TPA: PH domain-containing protein, partial [Propionibacteriaceae bacterium]|nr:PH domain-containing protein [Propionibacteriaceae bacterium]
MPTPPLTGQRVVERAHPLTPFVRGWLFFVAMIGWIGKDYLPNSSRSGSSFEQWNPLYIGLVVLVIALLIGLSGLVTWLTTKFVADETELSVETGWLFRRSNRIAYSRIQSVDMVQPLAARIFGLAEVKIDVGGEGATKLQYLTRARATEL